MTHSYYRYEYPPPVYFQFSLDHLFRKRFFVCFPFYYYALNLPRHAQVDCSPILSNAAFSLYYTVYVQSGLSFLSFLACRPHLTKS